MYYPAYVPKNKYSGIKYLDYLGGNPLRKVSKSWGSIMHILKKNYLILHMDAGCQNLESCQDSIKLVLYRVALSFHLT